MKFLYGFICGIFLVLIVDSVTDTKKHDNFYTLQKGCETKHSLVVGYNPSMELNLHAYKGDKGIVLVLKNKEVYEDAKQLVNNLFLSLRRLPMIHEKMKELEK